MSIEFQCPRCGKAYRVRDDLAGKNAKCTCGRQLKVPLPAPLAPDDDLFADLTEPDAPPLKVPATSQAAKAYPRTQPASGSRKKTAHPSLNDLLSLSGAGGAVLKILIGAAVGALAGWKGLLRTDRDTGIDPTLRIPMIIAFAGIGAFAAILLVTADSVRKRVSAGQHVPLILRLLFASRFLSIILWVALAFLGAIVLAFVTL